MVSQVNDSLVSNDAGTEKRSEGSALRADAV